MSRDERKLKAHLQNIESMGKLLLWAEKEKALKFKNTKEEKS